MSSKPIKNYPGIVPPVGYKLNPFSNNWVYCPDPKVINPLTGRCVNPDSRTLAKKTFLEPQPIKPLPSIESPKKESPKKESPKKESPKKESPKKESPKKESAKKESPKKESAKKKQDVTKKIIEDYMIKLAEVNKEKRKDNKKASSM